jgi:glycosyltransferase involved in cell wall biosynthesis
MRVLFISEYLFGGSPTEVGGTVGRRNMIIDGATKVGRIDFLFYTDQSMHPASVPTAQWEPPFGEQHARDMSLTFCPQLERARRLPVGELVRLSLGSLQNGAFSFFTGTISLRTSGDEQVRALESQLDRRPDVIVAHRLGAMAPLLRTRRSLPPILFDLDNLEHVKYGRIMRRCPRRRATGLHHTLMVGLLRLQYLLALPLLLWAEYKAIRLAHCTFVCSEKDRSTLMRWRAGNVVAIPNAMTVRPPTAPVTEPTLLFVGSYAARTNIDAAEFMIDKIWPRICSAKPEARLLIVGPHAERIAPRRVPDATVQILGYQEDLDPLYQQARLVVCPIRAGSGTRVKIVEAAAHGKPVVSTTLGAEGLEMTDGLNIILRDDATSFAEACVELLSDLAKCTRIGEQARRCVLERYDRSHVVNQIAGRLRSPQSCSELPEPHPRGLGG